MKIRERLDYFLAKIAGREVDIEDLTPPAAATATEELLEEIAERMENMGGGSFTKAQGVHYSSDSSGYVTNTAYNELLDALHAAGLMDEPEHTIPS